MPIQCHCGCKQTITRAYHFRGLLFASRACRLRWAEKNGRVRQLSSRDRREAQKPVEQSPIRERFNAGLLANSVLDEEAAGALLRQRISQVFSADLERIRRLTPVDDSPAAERALRELVFSGQSEGDDE